MNQVIPSVSYGRRDKGGEDTYCYDQCGRFETLHSSLPIHRMPLYPVLFNDVGAPRPMIAAAASTGRGRFAIHTGICPTMLSTQSTFLRGAPQITVVAVACIRDFPTHHIWIIFDSCPLGGMLNDATSFSHQQARITCPRATNPPGRLLKP